MSCKVLSPILALSFQALSTSALILLERYFLRLTFPLWGISSNFTRVYVSGSSDWAFGSSLGVSSFFPVCFAEPSVLRRLISISVSLAAIFAVGFGLTFVLRASKVLSNTLSGAYLSKSEIRFSTSSVRLPSLILPLNMCPNSLISLCNWSRVNLLGSTVSSSCFLLPYSWPTRWSRLFLALSSYRPWRDFSISSISNQN